VTENEKLLALLAEARELVCAHNEKERAVRDLIDAALAKPVIRPPDTTWVRRAESWEERFKEAEKERDEARSELEKVKSQRDFYLWDWYLSELRKCKP
jgi:hypothetical protein